MKTYIVNSFTNEAFKGNPAGVCLATENLATNKMQAIAKELGHSETAFVSHLKENEFAIRYFSPKMEIPLCGHASLAAAKVLFTRNVAFSRLHFKTIEGLDLKIEKENEAIQMNFPCYSTTPFTVPDALLKALGLTTITNCAYNKETNIMLLEIEDCNRLQNLNPDFNALYHSHDTINGVLVTALSNKENYDFESRYFWPWSGTNEDPVTGGTNTFLTPYWAHKLRKTKMNSFQCSSRTGFMQVELLSLNKISIKSEAQIVLEGVLNL